VKLGLRDAHPVYREADNMFIKKPPTWAK